MFHFATALLFSNTVKPVLAAISKIKATLWIKAILIQTFIDLIEQMDLQIKANCQ